MNDLEELQKEYKQLIKENKRLKASCRQYREVIINQLEQYYKEQKRKLKRMEQIKAGEKMEYHTTIEERIAGIKNELDLLQASITGYKSGIY